MMYKNNIILKGLRNHQNKLWYLPLSIDNEDEQVGDNENNLVNSVYEKKNQAELVSFLHATCFSPVKSTLFEDVKNENFATWTGLTAEIIAARLPKSEATVLVHLYQTNKKPDEQKVSN